jgi:predicted metal-dependent phosphoesterase TrpH
VRRIDLHTHSTASDGTDAPADLVSAARAAGLDVLALTDHDTVDGHAEAAAAVRAGDDGLVLVPGIELSCAVDGVSLHLLGYLFDPAEPDLAEQVRLLRTDRVRRARAMVDTLVQLGAPISWEQVERIAGDGAVGRPHMARALVAAGVVADVPAAFSPEWIGDGGRAYVPKYSLAPEQAIRLVKEAGGVTVFAHPAASSRGAIVTDADIERFAQAGLDGLEVDHPDHDPPTRVRLRALARDLRLVVTGSSDYHGFVKSTPIGAETTDPAVFDELAARADGAVPVRA